MVDKVTGPYLVRGKPLGPGKGSRPCRADRGGAMSLGLRPSLKKGRFALAVWAFRGGWDLRGVIRGARKKKRANESTGPTRGTFKGRRTWFRAKFNVTVTVKYSIMYVRAR